MPARKTRLTSIALVVLLGLSGLSFGFLVGRSHQLAEEQSQQGQVIATTSSTVQTSGLLLKQAVDGVRYLLIK